MVDSRYPRSGATAVLAVLLALTTTTGAWPQQAPRAPIPTFPPGPDFAGVAGTAAENARITALCGPNRNARDGYFAPPAIPGQTRAPQAKATQGYSVDVVAKIDRPWGFVFLPNGKMLVAFRAGGMRIVDRNGGVSPLLANVPAIPGARIGLGMFGLTLDRKFASNRTLYFGYSTPTGQTGAAALTGKIASARLSADEKSLEDVKVLREGADIMARAITQARDGTLLIASADLPNGGPNAQSLKSQAGKVLRINTDGSIPKDNPYLSNPDANPALYAVGFRDVHSIAINPQTGDLWLAENTPMGGDEINVVKPGKNYGFPLISYGRENSGALMNGGKSAQDGMEQPLYYWTPSIAPSGFAFYTGSALPGWKNNLFVGGMSGEQISRLELRNGKVVAEEKLLMDRCVRMKDIAQGPDGLLYVITDEPQAEVLRLSPAKTAPAPIPAPPAPAAATPAPAALAPPAAAAQGPDLTLGKGVYDRMCQGCHAPEGTGRLGPSIVGRTDTAHIAEVVAQGKGGMPALGGALSPAEVEAVANYVVKAFATK